MYSSVFLGSQASGCTIFVLTDDQNALFCNNEDWSDPKTRIWFNPEKGKFGCVYIGFDNGWGQGGMNTEGLAFDWVAGFKETWEHKEQLPKVQGNPAQRMLESCATVEEAIRFFEQNWEPSFSYGRILVADRSGTSAVIGAKDNRLQVVKANTSGGFGYNAGIVKKMLVNNSAVSVENGLDILKASQQQGQFATKYSNIFDLKTGRIFIHQHGLQEEPTVLELQEELKKGPHFYELPKINQQKSVKGKKLTRNMKRF